MKKSNKTNNRDDFDELIDRFIQRVNQSPREPVWYEDVPESVGHGAVTTDEWNYFLDWQIKSFTATTWIQELEAKLPAPLPQSFYSLVSRYIFPQFSFGGIHLLANTPEGIREVVELRTGIFADAYMSSFLLKNGFIQFANPGGGSNYDPICFDTEKQSYGEYRVLQIDYEEILCHDKISITKVIAPSFQQIVADYLDSFTNEK